MGQGRRNGSSGPKLSKRPGLQALGAARSMCNSLPLRASHLRPMDDSGSAVEGPRPRGERDCNIFLTLTPLSGPWRGPWRSQARLNATHAQPSASGRQTAEASAVRAGRERQDRGGGGEGRGAQRRGGEEGSQAQTAPVWVSAPREVLVGPEVRGGLALGRPWRSRSATSPPSNSSHTGGARALPRWSPGGEEAPCLGVFPPTAGLRHRKEAAGS